MGVEDYYLIEDDFGEIRVSGCCNCPFNHESTGSHCVLRPQWLMKDHDMGSPRIPEGCPLIGPGVTVSFDANREEFLARQGEPGVAIRRAIDPRLRDKE